MKRSVRLRLLCLCVAAAVLGSALLVAAVTGSPYEVLKKSALETLKLTNGTMNVSAKVSIGGETEQMESNTVAVDGTKRRTESGYEDENFYLYGFSDSGFIASRRNHYGDPSYQTLFDTNLEDRELRIMELAADMLTGDLKNNIAMNREGDLRYFSATILENQVPELYALILDYYAAESFSSSYYSIATNELTGYDLDSMTGTMRDTSVYCNRYGGDYWLQYNNWDIRLLTPEDSEYPDYAGQSYWTVLIEGKEYVWCYGENDGSGYTETAISFEEAKALVSAKTSASFSNPMDLIGFIGVESFRFQYGHAEAIVNDDNIITYLKARMEFLITDRTGGTCELGFELEGSITDIGSTVVTAPCDLNELDRVMGIEDYSRILFNDDGSLLPINDELYKDYVANDLPVITTYDKIVADAATGEIIDHVSGTLPSDEDKKG